jgi:hypothetical protein
MVVQPSSANPIQPGTTVPATFYWWTVARRSYYANAFVASALTAALFEAVPDTPPKLQRVDRYCRVDEGWRSSRVRLNDGRRSRGRAAFRCSRRREAPGSRSWGRKLGVGAQSARALSDTRRARPGRVRRGGSAVACRSDRSSRGAGRGGPDDVLVPSRLRASPPAGDRPPLDSAEVCCAGCVGTFRRSKESSFLYAEGVACTPCTPSSSETGSSWSMSSSVAAANRRPMSAGTATAPAPGGSSARAGTARPPSAGSIEVAS